MAAVCWCVCRDDTQTCYTHGMHKNIKGIAFDADDTLLKTQETKFQALKAAGQRFYDLTITDERLLQHWGKPFALLMDELFERAEPTEQIIAKYMSIVREFQNQAYDDALRAVGKLCVSYELSVLTSASRDLIEYDLQTTGFDLSKFAYIQAEGDTSVHKPDPLVFQPLLTHFSNANIEAHELIAVGDMPSDYRASTGAGLNFVGIARTPAARQVFAGIGASCIASLDELPDYIAAL